MFFFDGLAAARQNDKSACGSPITGEVASTVLINGMPAATVGSIGAHGNNVVSGSSTVIIGNSHTPAEFVPPSAMPLWAMIFDEKFRIVGSDGQPLANVPYHIKDETGRVYTGFSDEAGHTPRIATSKQETLKITLTLPPRSQNTSTAVESTPQAIYPPVPSSPMDRQDSTAKQYILTSRKQKPLVQNLLVQMKY